MTTPGPQTLEIRHLSLGLGTYGGRNMTRKTTSKKACMRPHPHVCSCVPGSEALLDCLSTALNLALSSTYPATSLLESTLIWYGLEEKRNQPPCPTPRNPKEAACSVHLLGREGWLMGEALPSDCSPGTLNSEHLRKERMAAVTLVTSGQMCVRPLVYLPLGLACCSSVT